MRKEFTVKNENDEDINLCVREPLEEDIEEANRVYASKVGQLMRLPKDKRPILREKVEEYLRDEGIWTDEDENRVLELSQEIDDLLKKLRKGGMKMSEGRQICVKILDKRREITDIQTKRRSFDEATLENMAESERIDYLVWACTLYSDTGDPYWETLEDMKYDKQNDVYEQGVRYIYSTLFGIEEDFEQNLPESKWLKKYSFLDDNMRFVDRKTGKYVDRDGNPIEDQPNEDQFDPWQGDIEPEEEFVDDYESESV